MTTNQMKTYTIHYSHSVNDYYTLEASSPEEAEEMFYDEFDGMAELIHIWKTTEVED